MFDRTRPCADCPFRKGMGHLYALPRARLDEIAAAPAFQCHKTTAHGAGAAAVPPQQCAGLMAVLLAEGRPNQIMQIAMRTGHLDPDGIDGREACASLAEVHTAHSGGETS